VAQDFRTNRTQTQTLIVRAAADAGSASAAVRAAVAQVDPELPVVDVRTMEQQISGLLVTERFGAVLMSALASVGVALAALGLYGVLAYLVGQRRHEFGIRMALGALPKAIFRMVVREGAALIAIGLVIGIAAALALSRGIAGMLYQLRTSDPFLFGVMALMLVSVGLVACMVPARRATSVEPMVALRDE
jgi:putative ABC transport system permease protein